MRIVGMPTETQTSQKRYRFSKLAQEILIIMHTPSTATHSRADGTRVVGKHHMWSPGRIIHHINLDAESLEDWR